MGSLAGFRPPQFSEDAAWLPIWLQRQNVEQFDEGINGEETPFEQRVKELQFSGQDISTEENINVPSSSEVGYKSCHLFWSGDESSPLSFASSAENVIHFHLHLSSVANSESMPSPLGDASQVHASQVQELATNCALLKQTLGTSVVSEGKINNSTVEANAFLLNCSLNSGPYNENHIMNHDENIGYFQADDVSEAVELSIAASEALVIHDMVTGLGLKPLPSSTVLEVAIQMKQARIDIWKQSSNCSTTDVGEIDILSDLDDSTMADAYEDVGLSIVDCGDLHSNEPNISHVKDTLASENDRDEGILKYKDTGINVIGFGKSLDDFQDQKVEECLHKEVKVEDVSESEISSINRHKKLPSHSAACLDSMNIDYANVPAIRCSAQENLQVSALVEMQMLDYDVGQDDFFQEPLTSLARTSDVSEKHNNVTDVVPTRFQSRWFGGWTWKEDKASFSRMEHQNFQGIPKPFVGETSFLSESADVAPDENSVQKQAKRSVFNSQSSIPSEVYCNKVDKEALLSQGSMRCSQSSIPSEIYCKKVDEEPLLSQAVMRCSSLSSSDPLCSVVPCSFSSENVCSSALLDCQGNTLSINCSISQSEYTTDNLQKASTLVELIHAEECTVPMNHSKELQPAVRQQFTSLRPYSVTFTNPLTMMVKENICDRTFPLETIPKSSIVENIFSSVKDMKNFNDAVENGSVTTILGAKEKILTPLLHPREQKSVLMDGTAGPLLSKEAHKVQSSYEKHNSNQVPARKHVHFAEAETNNPQEKKHPKQQTALKNCYTSRRIKRLGSTNQRSKSGAQELKVHQPNYFCKNRKRLIFQNMEFLLTGFSSRKEKQYEGLIRKYGGVVLSDVPFTTLRGNRSSRFSRPHMFPIVLSSKKLQTIKFLYGCAVNAFMLKVDWLTDSIEAGSVLPPERYSLLTKRVGRYTERNRRPFTYNFSQPIFKNLGIMLHGKNNFCSQMTNIIKHGGGRVFKTLRCLVDNVDAKRISIGAIVAENESRASRHLKHCALERKIPMMPASWIIKSLHMGKLLPRNVEKNYSRLAPLKYPDLSGCIELSEEI